MVDNNRNKCYYIGLEDTNPRKNKYDGIVIDKIWVGYSKFWMLPGCEDIPYVQTWLQVLKKECKETRIDIDKQLRAALKEW